MLGRFCPGACRALQGGSLKHLKLAQTSCRTSPAHSHRRKSALAAEAVRSKRELPKGVSPVHREDVARIIEQAESGLDDWATRYTDFYTPPVIGEALAALEQTAVCAVAWGGFAQAERTRIAFIREEIKEALGDSLRQIGGVAVLNVRGNFMFDAASHRDFLGACLGTGIDRSKVGDVLINGEQGAHIMVVPELVEYLSMNLTSVRSVPVEVEEVQLHDLTVPEPRTQVMRSVEASMRLDAIASAGFRVSRSKMLALIKSGDVRVNWQPAKASDQVAEGDVISCSGKGRVEVKDASLTKKGRHAVELNRLL